MSLFFCLPIYARQRKNYKKTIPHIIHQIWIGGPVPEKYKPLMKTWIDKHPTWEYRLWTDKDIELFNIENKKLFNRAQNYGLKSDIWRYEILWRYGGIYVDTDFECLKELDELIAPYELFGAQFGGEPVTLSNGILGACRRHAVFRACINRIKALNSIPDDPEKIMSLAGPNCFALEFSRYKHRKPHAWIREFSWEYFFPFPPEIRHLFWNHNLTRDELQAYIKPETHAVHYWACSWTTIGATEGTLPFMLS